MAGIYERKPHLLRLGDALVADDATIVGDVSLGAGVSVWYGSVIRGDVAPISVGAGTNVQDLCVIHPMTDEEVIIGEDNNFGHGAIFHGRVLGDGCLLGMRSTVLRGAHVGSGCLIAAGAVVCERSRIPDGSLVMGMPGKVVRQLDPKEIAEFRSQARYYLGLAKSHLLQP